MGLDVEQTISPTGITVQQGGVNVMSERSLLDEPATLDEIRDALRALERKGLIESFIGPDGEVRWREVPGKNFDGNIPSKFGLDS
jgi:hypothetical protein